MIQHSTVNKTSATKLARVEVKSRREPELVFSNLGHIIDMDLLRECYRSLDGSKAVGIDGVTKILYGKNLEANLTDLLQRIRMGTYIPQPSRTVDIPKLDGTTRPLAIACVEDKIVQEACKRILERIYEPLFLPESFGFRPGSSPHKALVALDGHLKSPNNGAVIDVDLRKAFDTIPHCHLEEMLRRKISDARFLHLLLKLTVACIRCIEVCNCGQQLRVAVGVGWNAVGVGWNAVGVGRNAVVVGRVLVSHQCHPAVHGCGHVE